MKPYWTSEHSSYLAQVSSRLMNADVFCAAYALQIVWSIIQCVAIAMVDQHARNNSLFIGCFPSDLRIFAPHIWFGNLDPAASFPLVIAYSYASEGERTVWGRSFAEFAGRRKVYALHAFIPRRSSFGERCFVGCVPLCVLIANQVRTVSTNKLASYVNVVEGSATSRTKSRCFRSVGLNAELLSAVFALQVNRHDNHLRCPAYATSTPLSSLGSGTTLEREIARGRLFEPAETAPKPVQATLEVEP